MLMEELQRMERNKPISKLTKEDLQDIKLIVFDVDGVFVPRGPKIKQEGTITTLETKVIQRKQIEQNKKLHDLGFMININSGRGLYMLQEMFREILPFVSLTYENGSATSFKGKIYQHLNSFAELKDIFFELKKIKSENIKGFEPKEFIITIHCEKPVKKIELLVAKLENLYTIWNGEAYDIGIKEIQTKDHGLKAFMKINKLRKKNVPAIGDNFNDRELLEAVGIAITADKDRVSGNFYIPLDNNKELPAKQLMDQIFSALS